MDKNLDNILQSIKSLSPEDANEIIYFLLERNKTYNLTQKEKEIVSFMTEKSKEFEKWNKEVKELLIANREFFNELKRSAWIKA